MQTSLIWLEALRDFHFSQRGGTNQLLIGWKEKHAVPQPSMALSWTSVLLQYIMVLRNYCITIRTNARIVLKLKTSGYQLGLCVFSLDQ